MEENPKKYRVTDKEGAKLYLDAIHPQAKNTVNVPDETERQLKRLKFKAAGIFTFIGVLAVVLGIIGYYAVRKFRAEAIALREISVAVNIFEDQAPSGPFITDDYEAAMVQADSLLRVLDGMIAEDPDKDTLKTMWTSVMLHKYEKYLHYSLKNSLYDELKRIDTADIVKAQKYNGDFTNLIPIMYSLPDFYRFSEIYNIPPRLSYMAPKQFEVEELIDKAKEIQYIADKNAVILQVHFPVLSNWINYFSNTVIPQIYEWEAFWRKYKEAVGNTNDKLSYDRIMKELAFEFPNLEILKTGGTEHNLNYFRIGMVYSSLIPLNSDARSEIMPVFDYFKKTFNQNMNLVLFDNYYELYLALKDGKVDLAVMNFAASATCYFSGVGMPIAQRVWNRGRYTNYAIYGVGRNIGSDNYLSSIKTATLVNDDYLFFKYFSNGNPNMFQAIYNKDIAPGLDYLADMINNKQCGAVLISDEEYYYLKSGNKLKVELVKYKSAGTMPLDVLWASDSISPVKIRTLQNILIPVMPADIYRSDRNAAMNHPYGDWDAYENAVMINYYNDSRKLMFKLNDSYNRIHLFPIVSESDSLSIRLRNELTEYLEESGFKVLHSNSSTQESRKPNDSYVSVSTSKDKNGNLVYNLKVHKYDKSGRKMVYNEQFRPGQGRKIPDFKHKLFDLALFVNICGTITKTENGMIEISTDMNLPDVAGRTVYLFKRDKDLSDPRNSYAKLLITDVKNGKITAYIGKIDSRLFKTGDLGVVFNVQE